MLAALVFVDVTMTPTSTYRNELSTAARKRVISAGSNPRHTLHGIEQTLGNIRVLAPHCRLVPGPRCLVLVPSSIRRSTPRLSSGNPPRCGIRASTKNQNKELGTRHVNCPKPARSGSWTPSYGPLYLAPATTQLAFALELFDTERIGTRCSMPR
jgi:hypothetical protein